MNLANMSLRTKFAWSFGIILALLLALAAAAFQTTLRNQAAATSVTRTERVVSLTNNALAALVDMETGYRGFLLTGQDDFLQPYTQGQASYLVDLQQLETSTADEPDQAQRWQDLQQRVQTWQREVIEPGIAVRRQYPASAGLPAAVSSSVASEGSKEQFNGIRSVLSDAVAAEEHRLDALEAISRRSNQALLITLVGGSALAVLLSAAIAIVFSRDTTRAMGHLTEAARAFAEGNLSHRVELQRRDEIGTVGRAFDAMAQRLEATIQENERQRLELERSNRELQDFASVASHDLQEPLRKIQAFGARLVARQSAGLSDEGRDSLQRMRDAAQRMSMLITDLLEFSRVTTKVQPFVPVDLGAVATDVLSDLEVRLAESGGSIHLQPLPTIEADPAQMRRLFQNLFSNALKFRRPETPPVVQVYAEAHDSNGQTPGFVRVAVQDNGIGFDEKYLDRIFTIFQRLHGREEYEGTGVGLAVCRKIVERHGGTLTARSTPGQGATFIIELPVSQAAQPTAATSEYPSPVGV